MAEVKDIISSIKSGDLGAATELVHDMLAQKTLDKIDDYKQIVGQQMLGQTSTEEDQDEFVDNEEILDDDEVVNDEELETQ